MITSDLIKRINKAAKNNSPDIFHHIPEVRIMIPWVVVPKTSCQAQQSKFTPLSRSSEAGRAEVTFS